MLGVLRQTLKLMRLKLRDRELTTCKKLVKSYTSAMSGALQMINV